MDGLNLLISDLFSNPRARELVMLLAVLALLLAASAPGGDPTQP